jgi:hypothetical protein
VPTERVTCEALANLIADTPDRVAVLMILRDVEGKPGGSIQFVTAGKTAADKVEAHQLRDWIKDEVFDGKAPEPTVHESFILDAARNKERLERCIAALRWALPRVIAEPDEVGIVKDALDLATSE